MYLNFVPGLPKVLENYLSRFLPLFSKRLKPLSVNKALHSHYWLRKIQPSPIKLFFDA
jgi:hypothetical protein